MHGDDKDDQFYSFIGGARQDPEPWAATDRNGPPTQPWAALTDERLNELDKALPSDLKVAPMRPQGEVVMSDDMLVPKLPPRAKRPRRAPRKEGLTRTQARLARRRRRRRFHLGCTIAVVGWIALFAYVLFIF